eukprot:m.405729 g.405729  ORF g.405729 m.405729 type:complete len:1069 (-) comp21209_c0_seq2:189-3395(-)
MHVQGTLFWCVFAAITPNVHPTQMNSTERGRNTPFSIAAALFSLTFKPDNCTVTLLNCSEIPSAPQKGVDVCSDGTTVPFMTLYNRVADNHPKNLEEASSCELLRGFPYEAPGRESARQYSTGTIRVYSKHDYGWIDIFFNTSELPSRVSFSVENITAWHADPVERHIAFGEFWQGIVSDMLSPTIMGKLQGPISKPGAGQPSAGYMSVSRNSYYKYIFYADVSDKVVFTYLPAGRRFRPSDAWMAVAADIHLVENPNRFLTWLWTDSDFTEQTRSAYASKAKNMGVDMVMATGGWDTTYLTVSQTAFPSGINDTVQYLASQGVRLGLHMHPDIVWPCMDTEDIDCIATGVGVSPVVLQCPACVMQEGLAPTYRSGDRTNLAAMPTEDLGFWWCHEMQGTIAHNGNRNPCGQGTCNVRDWNVTWGSNMTLHNTEWSKTGAFRGGGALAFSGDNTSYGIATHCTDYTALRSGLTLGMTIHRKDPSATAPTSLPDATPTPSCLAVKDSVFSLCLESARAGYGTRDYSVVVWTVFTVHGPNTCKHTLNNTASEYGAPVVLRVTYNATSATSKIFANGVLGASCTAKTPGPAEVDAQHRTPIAFGRGFHGAVEEIYLKNTSTEHRVGYMYADDNRVRGTYLLDLSSRAGQDYFAKSISNVLNLGDFAAVQYDGFEKLNLIAAKDFAHSNQTQNSGLYRGLPTPDWYHFEGWPLRAGLGVLQGMTAAHDRLTHAVPPAIEASFMAPGLGPWRPDMAPYVDEHGPDLVQLGRAWHGKMLVRVELTGTVVNPYNTALAWFSSACEVDYWLGGLVTGGVAFQGHASAQAGVYDVNIRDWMMRYNAFGHLREDSVTTLVYDADCCHTQGTCEWIACNDVVLVELAGGSGYRPHDQEKSATTTTHQTIATRYRGLYVASAAWFAVPPSAHSASSRITAFNENTTRVEYLLFQAAPGDGTLSLCDDIARHTGGGQGLHTVPDVSEGTIEGVNMTVGSPADVELVIHVTSPATTAVTMSRGFWTLHARQNVRQRVQYANGTIASDGFVFAAPASEDGPVSHQYKPTISTFHTVVFDKVDP